jgi:CheY-like chemotaxis protein
MNTNIKNILLVDDSTNDVTLIEAALKDAHFGNNIIVAEDGEEALDFYIKGEIRHLRRRYACIYPARY